MRTIKEYPAALASIDGARDVLVLVLTASRTLEGETVSVVGAQKDAALEAAKSVLQCLGVDVGAFSYALPIPRGETEGLDPVGLSIDVAIVAPDETASENDCEREDRSGAETDGETDGR
ncbi:MAG: hypothetical protein IJM30_04220 [Thermoguttaceae bacterium]|nr:hypothetical protein [Thermoguttaceae bacterium]